MLSFFYISINKNIKSPVHTNSRVYTLFTIHFYITNMYYVDLKSVVFLLNIIRAQK